MPAIQTQIRRIRANNDTAALIIEQSGSGNGVDISGGDLFVGGGVGCISTSGAIHIHGLGVMGDANTEQLELEWTGTAYAIKATKSGTGSYRDLVFQTGGSTIITVSSDGQTTIQTPGAAVKALVVKGATSQTATLQEWQDSVGTALGSISASGLLTVAGGLSLLGGTQVIRAGSGASLTLGSNGSNIITLSTAGAVTVTAVTTVSGAANAQLTVTSSAANAGFSVASTSAGGQGWVFYSTATGGLHTTAGSFIMRNGTTDINVYGFDNQGRMSLGSGTSTVFAASALLHVKTNATVTIGAMFEAGSAAHQPVIIRAAASQSGNLLEWQNSSSGVLGTITENGYFTTRKTTVPADAELATGELAFWFDSTAGAAKLMIKAKNASGTVVSGSVNLT